VLLAVPPPAPIVVIEGVRRDGSSLVTMTVCFVLGSSIAAANRLP
jgi:hypothetical protein